MRSYILEWLKSLSKQPTFFVEPFAGGASVGLAVADAKVAKQVVLVEKDPEVAALWRVVFSSSASNLTSMIRGFSPTRKKVEAVLCKDSDNDVALAFRCLVRNRFQYGGVMAPGAGLLRDGEDEKGISSRWYVDTLCDRIKALKKLSPRIKVIEGDGLKQLRVYCTNSRAALFIDPPYIINGEGPGKRLYKCCDVEPSDIFSALATAEAAWLVTYHQNGKIRDLAEKAGFRVESVKVRTAHHLAKEELVIRRPVVKILDIAIGQDTIELFKRNNSLVA